MKTALYRHFNSSGELLYVGISKDVLRRQMDHNRDASWYEDIARINVQWFDTRELAIDAERTAIVLEKPRWNRAGIGVQLQPDAPALVRPRRVDSVILHRADTYPLMAFDNHGPMEPRKIRMTTDQDWADAKLIGMEAIRFWIRETGQAVRACTDRLGEDLAIEQAIAKADESDPLDAS